MGRFHFKLRHLLLSTLAICLVVTFARTLSKEVRFANEISEITERVRNGNGSLRVIAALESATSTSLRSPVVADARIVSQQDSQKLIIDWLNYNDRFDAVELTFSNNATKQFSSEHFYTHSDSYYCFMEISVRDVLATMGCELQVVEVKIIGSNGKDSEGTKVRRLEQSKGAGAH